MAMVQVNSDEALPDPDSFCRKCDKQFDTPQALRMHKLRKHGKLKGNPAATSKSKLTKTQSKTAKLKFPCQFCPRKFETKNGLAIHNHVHKPKKGKKDASNGTQVEARTFSEAEVQFAQHVSFLAGTIHKEIRLFAERHDVSGQALTTGVVALLRDEKIR